MRTIKFRGKRLDNGEWIYGGYHFEHGFAKDNEKHYITVYETLGAFTYNKFVLVEPETVGQFTGLLDKNGNKIFEGDVIDINQTVNGCNLFEIVWDKTQWNARYFIEMITPRLYEYNFNELVDANIDVYEKEIEIVGNIHDNGDLYKEIKGEIK